MARFCCRLTGILVMTALMCMAIPAHAEPLEAECPLTLTAPAAVLMEAETGAVIFEKNSGQMRPAASVTKLMTLLIALEKLEQGEISLKDAVSVSKNAAGQTGSEAFLDAYAVYPLEDLLRSTIIASANDSAVALAEYIAGSEERFAALMNEKAEALGLENTCYVNCTGLPAEGQYTCAMDVARISAAVCRYPLYFQYSSVWMDTLIHPSGRKTDLTNTNRLVRFYQDCDGLKTGSTQEAKYCLTATAERNGMRLIAVVLGVPNSQTRFDEARAMLDYGFSVYRRITVAQKGDLIGERVKVRMGAREEAEAALGEGLSMLLKNGQEKALSYVAELPEYLDAPMQKGEEIGKICVLLDGRVVAVLPAVTAQEIRLPGWLEGFARIFENWHESAPAK